MVDIWKSAAEDDTMDMNSTDGENFVVTNTTATPDCTFACTSVMFSPGAITGVVVVAFVILSLVVVRGVVCAKSKLRCPRAEELRGCPPRVGCPLRPAVRRARCCSYCVRNNAVSSADNQNTCRRAAPADPDLPPGYEEVIGTTRYNRKKKTAATSTAELEVSESPLPPPSYDRIEKGEFTTTAATDNSAVQRLRHAIMSKSRQCLVGRESGQGHGEPHAGRSDGSVVRHETVVEINCVTFPGGDYRDVSIQTADVSHNGTNDGGGVCLHDTWSRTALSRLSPDNNQGSISRSGSNASSWTIPSYSALVHPPTYDSLSCDIGHQDHRALGVHNQVPEVHVVMINTPQNRDADSTPTQHDRTSQEHREVNPHDCGDQEGNLTSDLFFQSTLAPLERHVSCTKALCRRESERLSRKIQGRYQLRRSSSLSQLDTCKGLTRGQLTRSIKDLTASNEQTSL